jgi:hypothetical protein
MIQNPDIERVLQVKRHYEQALLAHPNVVGVGIGFKTVAGAPTDTLALIVNVVQKQPPNVLTRQDVLPTELDGVPVDVQEVGEIRAL